MAKPSSKDLFDESTMTFGEHLEVLRFYVIRALIGWGVAVILAFYWGESLVMLIRQPIDQAIFQMIEEQQLTGKTGNPKHEDAHLEPGEIDVARLGWLTIQIAAKDLVQTLHQAAPTQIPESVDGLPEKPLAMAVYSPELKQLQERVLKPKIVTTNAQEAFLTYMRVSMVAGTVIASPWIFFQLWQFVAAGLYPHEQKYVYRYGALSLLLFLGGAVFCFYLVMPLVLKFLLGFNTAMDLELMNRLSEYISFAVMLPLMFGISWELPLVMVFLNKINIFNVSIYREKRRIAIFVIATLSVFLTPAEPISMLLMMFPLIGLYELGILLCGLTLAENPFHELTPA
ncbi:Sec-independent protein translocase protein TatCy [Planctomyces sp. SH-PL14]|nr:Sec-independent protein translocase protein TatCy [Planctomyces sp. SH-PL14]